MDAERTFFGIQVLKLYVLHIHGYLGMTVCVIGSIFNVFNIIVFTLTTEEINGLQDNMFACLAFIDLLTLINSMPGLWFKYVKSSDDPFVQRIIEIAGTSLRPMVENLSSMFLAVMSFWTFVGLFLVDLNPTRWFHWCQKYCHRAYTSLTTTLLLSLVFEITKVSMPKNTADLCSQIFKTVPTILMIIFDLGLVGVLMRIATRPAHERSKNILLRSVLILLFYSLLRLLSLIPRDVIDVLVTFDKKYYAKLLKNCKELLQIASLMNSAISFILYYTTNETFRNSFRSIFNRFRTNHFHLLLNCVSSVLKKFSFHKPKINVLPMREIQLSV